MHICHSVKICEQMNNFNPQKINVMIRAGTHTGHQQIGRCRTRRESHGT